MFSHVKYVILGAGVGTHLGVGVESTSEISYGLEVFAQVAMADLLRVSAVIYLQRF